jgi:hypothetical protein
MGSSRSAWDQQTSRRYIPEHVAGSELDSLFHNDAGILMVMIADISQGGIVLPDRVH